MHISELTYMPCIRKNSKSNYENDKDMRDSLNGVTIEYLDQEIYVNHIYFTEILRLLSKV